MGLEWGGYGQALPRGKRVYEAMQGLGSVTYAFEMASLPLLRCPAFGGGFLPYWEKSSLLALLLCFPDLGMRSLVSEQRKEVHKQMVIDNREPDKHGSFMYRIYNIYLASHAI